MTTAKTLPRLTAVALVFVGGTACYRCSDGDSPGVEAPILACAGASDAARRDCAAQHGFA